MTALCVQLISPRLPGHAGEGFAAAGHLAEADLKPNAWPASLIAGQNPNVSPVIARSIHQGISYLKI